MNSTSGPGRLVLALLAAAACQAAQHPAPPPSMKAARIATYGHADAISIEEVPVPTPGPGQVLLEVYASSINPVDTWVREGKRQQRFPLKLPVTLGWDVAGVVREVGPGVTALRVGDEVYGQASVTSGGSGAFAEYAVARADLLGRKPRNLGFTDAASLPLAGTSAVQGIVDHIALRPNQKILIHGGGGGIGSVAIQIARSTGAHVVATATGVDVAFAKQLGADEVVDYRAVPFEERLSGFDAVFDTVGGDTYSRSFKVLKRGGILVSMTHPTDARRMEEQYGVTVVAESTSMKTADLDALSRLVEAGVVTPHVDRTYPLERVREAFEEKERGGGRVRGKIAVVVRR